MAGVGKRILFILLGLLMIFLAIASFFFPEAFLWGVMVVASIAILTAGMAFIIEGAINKELKTIVRILAVIAGIFAGIIGIILMIRSIVDPLAGLDLFLFIVAITLLVLGIYRIVEGIGTKSYPGWYRVLGVIVGILEIIFSIIIFIDTALGALFVIVFVQIWLIIEGVSRIIQAFLPSKEVESPE